MPNVNEIRSQLESRARARDEAREQYLRARQERNDARVAASESLRTHQKAVNRRKDAEADCNAAWLEYRRIAIDADKLYANLREAQIYGFLPEPEFERADDQFEEQVLASEDEEVE